MPATPRPWKVVMYDQVRDADGQYVADCNLGAIRDRADEAPANADLIVRAVNAHDDLLAACQSALAYIDTRREQPSVGPLGVMITLEAAIEKATKPE